MEALSLTRKLRDSCSNYSLQLRSFIILFERKTKVSENGNRDWEWLAVTLKFLFMILNRFQVEQREKRVAALASETHHIDCSLNCASNAFKSHSTKLIEFYIVG